MLQAEYEMLATTQHPSLYFARLDYKAGPDVFRALQLNSAPYALYFPASPAGADPSDPLPEPRVYDFNQRGIKGEDFAAWVSRESGLNVNLKRPFGTSLAFSNMSLSALDWAKAALFGGSAIIVVFILALFYRYFKVILESQKLWAVISIVCPFSSST